MAHTAINGVSMKKLMFGTISVLILLVFILWFINWWRWSPSSCSEIEETALHTLVIDGAGTNEVRSWLNEAYQLKESSIYTNNFTDGATGLTWERNNSKYFTRSYDDNLVQAHVKWGWLEPNGKEILDCIGMPDLYYADYSLFQEYALSLDLWYLEKGIVVRTTHFNPKKEAPIINENIIMTNIYFLSPGSAEEMNRDIAREGWAEYSTSVLKPWPGSWEEIVINKSVLE